MEVPEVRTGQDAKAGMTFPISGDACDIVWCYRMRKISTLFIVASAAFAQFPRAESAADRNPFAGQPDAGALHTVPQLREGLLKPSARITDGYQGVTATALDGAKISGVARNNDDFSIQILDAKGDLHLLSKAKLRDVLFQKNSLMPED